MYDILSWIPPLILVLHISKYSMLISSSLFGFWLCWIFLAALGLSLAVVGGLLSVVAHGLIAVALLAVEYGFQGMWAPAVTAQHLVVWHMGLVAARHVGSSQISDRTRVPLHWQADFHPLYHQGSPTNSSYINIFLVIMISEAHSLVDLTGKAQCSKQYSVSSCVSKAVYLQHVILKISLAVYKPWSYFLSSSTLNMLFHFLLA